MARRRMVPTRFFKDPDIMNLGSKDTQLILIGLILIADDEGREVAHPGMLGREMDYPADQVEAALAELAANDLILLYQVGKHRYYQLTRWREWQTLGGHTTPSRYPAPPVASNEPASGEDAEDTEKTRGDFGKHRGKSRKFPTQFNLRESNLTEEDGKHPQQTPRPENVLPFPTSRLPADDAAGQEKRTSPPDEVADLTNQVAHILKLPITDALARLVAEYAPLASSLSLSLLGEADAAREWIDGPKNQRDQRMTPAFFRRWLKRECQDLQRRGRLRPGEALATGTAGTARSPAYRPETAGGRRPPDLMHLAEEDALAKGENP